MIQSIMYDNFVVNSAVSSDEAIRECVQDAQRYAAIQCGLFCLSGTALTGCFLGYSCSVIAYGSCISCVIGAQIGSNAMSHKRKILLEQPKKREIDVLKEEIFTLKRRVENLESRNYQRDFNNIPPPPPYSFE